MIFCKTPILGILYTKKETHQKGTFPFFEIISSRNKNNVLYLFKSLVFALFYKALLLISFCFVLSIFLPFCNFGHQKDTKYPTKQIFSFNYALCPLFPICLELFLVIYIPYTNNCIPLFVCPLNRLLWHLIFSLPRPHHHIQ